MTPQATGQTRTPPHPTHNFKFWNYGVCKINMNDVQSFARMRGVAKK